MAIIGRNRAVAEIGKLRFTGGRGARLITGDDRMPKVIQPPPDFRAKARESRPHAPS